MGRLPFGLKLPPRPKRQRKATAGKGRGRGASVGQRISQPGSGDDDQWPEFNESVPQVVPSESESGRSEPELPDDGGSDSSSDADVKDAEALLPNATAQAEEEVVEQEFSEYKQTLARKETLVNEQQQQHQGSTGTYFSKTVGFESFSLAPTGRAVCYHCGTKIAKGRLRSTYYYDPKKPSRYMHASCIPEFVAICPESRKNQAISVMLNAAGSEGASSSNDASHVQIKHGVQELLPKVLG